jgi:hypothetical protein
MAGVAVVDNVHDAVVRMRIHSTRDIVVTAHRVDAVN